MTKSTVVAIDCSDPAAVSGASPGDACTDGSIYAGLSPDGNVAMFATAADAPNTLSWGFHGNEPVPVATSRITGQANTATLAGFALPAAQYCDSLSVHGQSDWYLPAIDELNVLYTNKNAGALDGTLNETGSILDVSYWSSSEIFGSFVYTKEFNTGENSQPKNESLNVRCVRSAAPPPDTTPDDFQSDLVSFGASPTNALRFNSEVNGVPFTITGVNTATPISISGEGNPEFSINGGAWTNIPTTVENGDTVDVRLTTAATPFTTHTLTLDIGGVTGVWSVTTFFS